MVCCSEGAACNGDEDNEWCARELVPETSNSTAICVTCAIKSTSRAARLLVGIRVAAARSSHSQRGTPLQRPRVGNKGDGVRRTVWDREGGVWDREGMDSECLSSGKHHSHFPVPTPRGRGPESKSPAPLNSTRPRFFTDRATSVEYGGLRVARAKA